MPPLFGQPRTSPKHCANKGGFTLLTMSVVLSVAALVFVSVLPGKDAANSNQKAQAGVNKMDKIEEAMRAFMTANGRRPCPADGQYGFNAQWFGIEAANPGVCTGGLPSAPLGPDGTGFVVEGTIPTKTLGLPDDYAFDAWGRQFSYIVDRRATQSTRGAAGQSTLNYCPYLNNAIRYNVTNPGVTITDGTGTIIDRTMYAFISHGPDGHGAWVQGGAGGLSAAQSLALRINNGSLNGNQNINAGVDTNFETDFTNVKVKLNKSATFDDIVWYRNDMKNTCCIGVACTPVGFHADASGAFAMAGYIRNIITGDVNGDGITDIIIGSATAAGSLGRVYVVYGSRLGFPDPLPLDNLNGTNGFVIEGTVAVAQIGSSLATGDVNGDGMTDILIGAPYVGAGKGAVYVVFGGPTRKSGTAWGGSGAPTLLNTGGGNLIDGIDGFRLDGVTTTDDNIGMVLTTGDVNGDGKADIIVSSRSCCVTVTSRFLVYVVYGGATRKSGTPWGAITPLNSGGTNVINAIDGIRLEGENDLDITYSLAAGDLNGDGYADIAIGTPIANNYYGYIYVVYGQPSMLPSTTGDTQLGGTCVNNIALMTGLLVGQEVTGTGFQSGTKIAAKPGVCGANSVTISLPATSTCFGTDMTVVATPVTTGVGGFIDGTKGFRLDGIALYGGVYNDRPGRHLATGDIDGDGKADLVIGAGVGTSGYPDNIYVIFGGSTRKGGTAWGPNTTLGLGGGNLINGTDGFVLTNAGSAPFAYNPSPVTTADIDGDGKADIIFGHSRYGFGGQGGTDIIFGGATRKSGIPWGTSTVLATGAGNLLGGTDGFQLDGTGSAIALGASVAAADINADGKSDIIMGVWNAGAGAAYVYFGRTPTANNPWPVTPYGLDGL